MVKLSEDEKALKRKQQNKTKSLDQKLVVISKGGRIQWKLWCLQALK